MDIITVTSSRTGRPRHPVREHCFACAVDDPTTICKHCHNSIPNRVRSIKTHLRKCSIFLKKGYDVSLDLDDVSTSVVSKMLSQVDKFGFTKEKNDFKFIKTYPDLNADDIRRQLFPLNASRRQRVREIVTDLIVLHNLPFTFADSNILAELIRAVNPCADVFLPTSNACRKVLEDMVQDGTELKKKIGEKSKSSGRSIGVAIDSWHSLAHDHILGIVLSCDDVSCPDSKNLKSVSETGVAIATIIEKWMQETNLLLEPYGSIINHLVSDDAAGCSKARRILALRHPFMCFNRCMAHQINLIVKDVVKEFGKEKLDLVKAFISAVKRSTKLTLAFNSLCRKCYGERNNYTLHTLLEIRWNSAHSSLCSILRVRSIIEAFCDYATYTIKKRKRPTSVFAKVGNETFLNDCETIEKIIRPLSYCSLLLQKKTQSLGTAMNCLIKIYSGFDSIEDVDLKKRIIQRLETRWNDYEQPLFLLSYFLQPNFHDVSIKVFDDLDKREVLEGGHSIMLSFASVYYRKFIPEAFDETSLLNEFDLLLSGTFDKYFKRYSSNEKPLICWRMLPVSRLPLFKKLATFLLSLTINSASCERLFSQYALVKTKRRNRLSPDLMKNLVLRKSYLEHELWSKKPQGNRVLSQEEYSKVEAREQQSQEENTNIELDKDDEPTDAEGSSGEEDLEQDASEDVWSILESCESDELKNSTSRSTSVYNTTREQMESFIPEEAQEYEFNEDMFFGKTYRNENGPISFNSEQEKLNGLRAFKISLKHLHEAWVNAVEVLNVQSKN